MNPQDFRTSPAYREGKHKLASIRWMLFFVVAVQTVVTLAVTVVSSFMETPPPVYLQMLLIELLAYLLPLSLYAKENRLLTVREAREQFGLKGFRKSLIPWVILAGCGCQFVMVLLNLPLNLLLAESDGYIPTTLWELCLAIPVLALVPAVFEEFLLRGIVHGIMANYNTRAALIFTTVMFALLHGNPAGIPGYLFLGMILVLLLRRTGSLYACMLFHLSCNITALLVSYFSSSLMTFPILTIQLFIFGTLGAIAGWTVITSMTKRPHPRLFLDTSEFLGQSFINLPILLCLFSILLTLIF
ncbi:MAG: CPBP family intramembrane metalloprotease [Clostridia bacterium]|nr:CPBP family intramembrane metalloprotease [Clostridia bacterium]